jgi:hypothetical protein
MNKEDRDIFKLMDTIPYEEKLQLLDDITFSEADISVAQRDKIKSRVLNKLKTSQVRKNKFKGRLVAAGIALCIILSALSPFGQKTLADIAKKLYFIPGLGRAAENAGQEVFILSEPIKYSNNKSNIEITTITKDNSRLTINMTISGYWEEGHLEIEDEQGNKYVSSISRIGSGYGWIAEYEFYNFPVQINSFTIPLPDGGSIPIALRKAESYEDFADMGPTDVKNDFGITLVPMQLSDKIKFDLIQHGSRDKQVWLYGKSDTKGHSNFNILIKDANGKSYSVEHPKSYMGTLSQFYFTTDSNSTKYTIKIPEITLKYDVNNEITLPMPEEGENQIDKVIDMHGFPLKITKILREENSVKIYVDSNYNKNNPENLSTIFVDFNAMGINHYKWNLNDDIITESIEFNINPKDKDLKIKFDKMYTIMRGPWVFEINTDN